MAQLKEEERKFLLEHLIRTRNLFLDEIADLRQGQWMFKPDAETWSIAECADHVSAIERNIFGVVSFRMQSAAPDPEKAEAARGKEQRLLRNVTNRGTRLKLTRQIEPTGRTATPEEFIAHFRAQRDSALHYVRETDHLLRDRVWPHMAFGDLDGYQWLLFIALHSERHAAQVAEVKTHPGYPKFSTVSDG